LNAYLVETDQAKRTTLSRGMQKLIAEDLPYGLLLRPQVIDAVRIDKWQGYTSTMGGVITWINPWTLFNIQPKP